jgi:cell division protein FtsL
MTRVQLVLTATLSASALWLVHSAHEGRRLFAAVEQARREAQALQAETQRLQAERQAQATHLRVERLAREKLRMRAATPAVTEYVVDGAAATGGEPR